MNTVAHYNHLLHLLFTKNLEPGTENTKQMYFMHHF